LSYLIAIIGCLLIVPYPAIGALVFCVAVWLHQSGLATPIGEIGEMLLFYGALVGIACAVLL